MRAKCFVALAGAFLLLVGPVSGQTYDFVTCGSSGSSGPSQSDCDSYYSGDNDVDIVGSGMQEWEVPQDGLYRIKASGASGSIGDGAIMEGVFSLDQRDSLLILVGQEPSGDGGAGGTFVTEGSSYDSASPLIIAGGGAGGDYGDYSSALDGSTSTSGHDAPSGPSGGTDGDGGQEGDGGCCGADGGGGGGFLYDGDNGDGNGGSAFRNGGNGGSSGENGAFGGGGAAEPYGDEAGGAGGYSGGGAAEDGSGETAGGGGSFIHNSASEAATSDGSFGTTGTEPHNTYSGNLNDLNSWNNGDGRVEITLVTDPDDPVIRNVNFNRQAGNPATIDGSFDVGIDDDGGNAPNNQLESCTVTAEGVDSGGQVDLGTSINGDSCSFRVDSNDHGSWNPDEQLRFEMEVEDSYSGTDQLNRFSQFRVNPPNQPELVSPSDGKDIVNTEKSFEVRPRHPDGLDMDVTFYLDDGSGYSQVASRNSVSDGSTVSVNQNLAPGTDYNWYAEAETQGLTTESNRWSFTTNYRPSIDNVDVEDKAEGHSLSVSSTVTDFDGRDQLDRCGLEVSDSEGDTESYSGALSPGGSSIEAVCEVDAVNFEDADWDHLEELDLEVEVTDDKGLSDSGSTSAKFPNHEPKIEDFYVRNYPDREGFRVEALIRPRDVGSDELRGCSIVVDDGSNSVTGGNMNRVNSTHVRCIQEDVGFGRFSDLDLDSEIEVEVSATDIHGESSSDSLNYNSGTGLDYTYSSVVLPEGGVEYIDYQLSNERTYSQGYEVRLENVNASFGESGDNVTTVELRGGSSETLSIKITPDIGFTGVKDLDIISENLETGIETEDSVKVRVRDVSGSTTRSVPGIGLVHVIVLVFLVYTLFYRRKL